MAFGHSPGITQASPDLSHDLSVDTMFVDRQFQSPSLLHAMCGHVVVLGRSNNTWCTKNNFESKLPKVVRSRKDVLAAEDRSKQSLLDLHLEEQHREIFVPYSDLLFREAVIEWLIATDQVS